jgi:hypothetical protein
MENSIIVAFITGVLGPILILVVKSYIDKRRKRADMLTDALETSTKVLAKIDIIKDKYEADRVWVTQFHNGGHFYPTGKSIAKLSMIYEVVAPGVASIQHTIQNVPVGLFSRSLNHLIDNNYIAIEDFKNLDIRTHGLRSIAETNGCKSGYIFAAKSIDGRLVGVLGLDYTKKKIKLDSKDVVDLELHAAALSGVLISTNP